MKKTIGTMNMNKFCIGMRQHRWFQILIITLLIFGSTLLFIQLFSYTSFKFNSLSFKLQSKLTAQGGTIVAVPPIGRLFLKSHLTPWQLVITLDEVDFSGLAKQLNSLPPKQQWLSLLQHEVNNVLLAFFASVAICGLLGGAFVMLVLRIHPLSRRFFYGMTCSALVILLLIGSTILTYQPNAIEHPRYEGVLSAAPWAMNLVTMSLDNIEVIGTNLKKISQTLPTLFKQAEDIKNMGELQTDLRVLHVSDIHNNPAAFDLIAELVNNFKIQFVIDTGDLTDYGTALEAKIIDRIPALKVPYVFIPGNHESPLILSRLAHTKRVILIMKKDLQIYGLKISGAADPAAFNYNSDTVAPSQYLAAQELFKGRISKLAKQPDIIAVHNRVLAEGLIGSVPLILHGHDHSYKLSIEADTVIVDAGTTGAAGLRGLSGKKVPYSASILYWKKEPQGNMKLRAIDSIKINNGEEALSIDRRTF
jgi:predicted phosphodiesterase